MTTNDEQIGQNLITFRGEMSQRDLADEMKKHGWKWSHVTVGSVERGERPLRLAEASDLAAILRTHVDSFARPPLVASVDRAAKELAQAGATVREALVAYRDAQMRLAFRADEAERAGLDLPLDGRFVESRLRQSFADIVADAEAEMTAQKVRDDANFQSSKKRMQDTRASRDDNTATLPDGLARSSRYVDMVLDLLGGTADGKHPEAP